MLLLLSLSLSLDALAVAAAYGFKSTRIPLTSKLVICIISVFYFAAAVWLGEQISSFFNIATAKIIGISLMSAICIWMLLQVLLNKKTSDEAEQLPKTLLNFSLNSLGLTFKIIRNPMLSDLDHSNSISPVEAIFLGTALSVDSISIGIGYSLLGHVYLLAPLMVGAFQFVFLWIGNWVGLKCTSSRYKISDHLQIVSVAAIFALILVRVFI